MNLMTIYTKAIEDFREANRLAAEASLTFSQIFRAQVDDLSRIKPLRAVYLELMKEHRFHEDGTRNDKQFVFAILHLYSPASLCGGAINKRLRRAIAEALEIHSESSLYRMRSVAVSWYDTYPLFRAECNRAVKAFRESLGIAET